ncbi:MAG TPA: NAD(P)/FAD-dependent oxidoreductase [Spirochaetia bacterium]|nr:NAD(P)/FAD-dependent oxidoreductase [Spirochaetia bacterium]
MFHNYDVAVIGAGVVGASICRELSRYKIRAALLEKEEDVSFGTSKANSGIIHAGFHAASGTLKAKLAVDANREFDRLAEELSFPFERRGELVVAFTEEEIQILQTLYRRGVENGVLYMELIGRERALEMEPNLNPDILGALYAPTAGIIGPYEYCFALVENAVQNGIDLFLGERVSWIGKKGWWGLQVETESGLKLNSRFVVNAAGLHADEVASYVGITDFKILPRKGEEYLLDRRVGNLVRRVIFPVPTATTKGMLVIPTVEGPVMVGPTAEDMSSKSDFSTTREGLKKVFEHAQRMVPGIRSSDVITSFVGIRPVATGDDFIIGETKVPGFINAAGIQSPGLTASPAIAEMVKETLLKQGLKLEVNPRFNPYRKSFMKIRECVESGRYDVLEGLTEKDRGYSRLVCRCENVTEAEVVQAIRRGHVTLDGIKYATRAGMGRCQGGFCTYRVMKIINRETGIPFERITKKGKGSEVVKIRLEKIQISDKKQAYPGGRPEGNAKSGKKTKQSKSGKPKEEIDPKAKVKSAGKARSMGKVALMESVKSKQKTNPKKKVKRKGKADR